MMDKARIAEARRLEEASTELARQLEDVSAELAQQMPELIRPQLAWIVLRHLSRAGATQIDVLTAAAEGLQRMNDLPVDLFLDLGVDPELVAEDVRGHLDKAAELIREVGVLLEAACMEVETVEAEPWEWRLT